MIKVAIIGGTGHESFENFSHLQGAEVKTPYGMPGSEIFTGRIDGKEIYYLSRVGKDKTTPYSANYRADLYALKQLGCDFILSTAECASLQEEIRPGEFLIPDQFIDMGNTNGAVFKEEDRKTPFGRKQMAEPFSEELRDHFTEAAIVEGITVHSRGTIVSISPGRYPTRAESSLYRKLGGDILDMSTSMEVIGANELGLPYAQVSLCTDYDVWRVSNGEDSLSAQPEIILAGYEKMMKILLYTIQKIQPKNYEMDL